MFHSAVRQLLLERNSEPLESFASLIDVINSDRDVTKAPSRFRVPTSISLEVGIGFRSVVVRELQDA